MLTAKGTFEVQSWDENAYHEGEGSKLTVAIVAQSFTGDIQGDGEARWLMAYRPDGSARFVGLQRIEGAFGGRRGSLVLETAGDFDGTTARWSANVVTGSGSGELTGLDGSGRFAAPHGSQASYEFEFRGE